MKMIHHEFQIIPLDFLMSWEHDPETIFIAPEIKEACGYGWLTTDTISLEGEIGLLMNLSQNVSDKRWTGSNSGMLIFGDGKTSWFDLMWSNGHFSECIIQEGENNEFINKIPNTKLRFLINEYNNNEILQPLEIAYDKQNNMFIVGSPVKNGELILTFNGYRYSFKHDTFSNFKGKNLLATEIAYETDTKRLKIGVGEKTSTGAEEIPYSELPYISDDQFGAIGEETVWISDEGIINDMDLAWWEDYTITIDVLDNDGFSLKINSYDAYDEENKVVQDKFYELSGTIIVSKNNIEGNNNDQEELKRLFDDLKFENWKFDYLIGSPITFIFENANCTIQGNRKDMSNVPSDFGLKYMPTIEKVKLL